MRPCLSPKAGKPCETCRQCWLFHNSNTVNKLWGGPGIKRPKRNRTTLPQSTFVGPGTTLFRMLSKLGYQDAKGCKCKAHAVQMDNQGIEWCEQNIDGIVGWMRDSAKVQGHWFTEAGARMLVWMAIEQSKATKPKPDLITNKTPPWEITPMLLAEQMPKFPKGVEKWPNFQEAMADARTRFKPRPWWDSLVPNISNSVQ